jgi:hypothetical protein
MPHLIGCIPAIRCNVAASIAWRCRQGFDVFDGTCLGKVLLKRLAQARQHDDRWREDELLKQRYQGAQNLAQMHSLYDQFDPCCELCSGTGQCVQSSDPAGQYDYWGIEAVDAVLTEQGCAVAALIDPQTGTYRILPAAIVTPEGEWYEGGIFLQSRFDQYQTGREKQPLAGLGKLGDCAVRSVSGVVGGGGGCASLTE